MTAIESFVEYHNHHRYHEALGNVNSADVYCGRRDDILTKRKEAKRRILQASKAYNRKLMELHKVRIIQMVEVSITKLCLKC